MLRKNVVIPMVVMVLFSVTGVWGHCQVPCGIYDDNARVTAMLEHAVTISKAMDHITELSGKSDPQQAQQLVRWVVTKEEHAEKIIRVISDYCLTQRVDSGQSDYVERLKRHHAVMRAAMKTKQYSSQEYVDDLKQSIEKLLKYYPAHRGGGRKVQRSKK
ncbi:MAG: superoxide dismutase [Ni] [Fibrobacterota bacterium]